MNIITVTMTYDNALQVVKHAPLYHAIDSNIINVAKKVLLSEDNRSLDFHIFCSGDFATCIADYYFKTLKLHSDDSGAVIKPCVEWKHDELPFIEDVVNERTHGGGYELVEVELDGAQDLIELWCTSKVIRVGDLYYKPQNLGFTKNTVTLPSTENIFNGKSYSISEVFDGNKVRIQDAASSELSYMMFYDIVNNNSL